MEGIPQGSHYGTSSKYQYSSPQCAVSVQQIGSVAHARALSLSQSYSQLGKHPDAVS